MDGFVSIGTRQDFTPGRITEVDVNGRALCVVQLSEKFYAFDRYCTHEFVELTYGYVMEGRVHCGQHGAAFNLETGDAEIGPADMDLRVFPVQVQDDEVFVRVE